MGRKQNPEDEFEWIPFCDYCYEDADDKNDLTDIAPPHDVFPGWSCEVCEQCLENYNQEEMINTVWERKFPNRDITFDESEKTIEELGEEFHRKRQYPYYKKK